MFTSPPNGQLTSNLPLNQVVHNVIDEYIQNQLPIYLLELEGMRLVRRGAVKGYIQEAIDGFIDQLLPHYHPQLSPLTDDYIRASTKDWTTDATSYAIFSHRWLDVGELTFQDVSKMGELSVKELQNMAEDRTTKLTGREILDLACQPSPVNHQGKKDSGLLNELKAFCDGLSADQRAQCQDLVKLVEFCSISSHYGCKFVWFDTGCIDKSRSAELEESIRSMFNWYRDAKICIVHLAETVGPTTFKSDPWFTRGWTLQELLAPKKVVFFGKSWGRITRHKDGNDKVPDRKRGIPLWRTISEITGIGTSQLLSFSAGIHHARDALTWVSRRQTTRIEDMAYCLIGLLQIPMSIAYGEGPMAFHRLQVEILQRSGDMGLFAWTGQPSPFNSMLAASAKCFTPLPLRPRAAKPPKDKNFAWNQPRSVKQTYMLTNSGLQIPLGVYNANIRNPEAQRDGGQSTRLQRYQLESIEMGCKVDVVSKNLEVYDHLGIAVLPGLADKTRSIAILLGMDGDCCIRIPTQDYIILPFISVTAGPIIRFIE